MSDLFNRIADLSPQKREMLTRLLKARGVNLASLPIVPRGGDRSIAPLSFAQQRLWFLHQLEPDNPFYNVPTIVRFAGALDAAALERALNAMVERHEALRTTFPIVEGQPAQVILPTLSVALRVIEMQRDDTVRELGRAEIQRPFDLAQGPLLRAVLLRRAAQEHVLVLTLHHIVADGWSMKIFIQELATFYQRYAQPATAGQSPALGPVGTPLPIQYADYAVWQRDWMAGELLDTQLRYWKQQLGAESSPLPTLNLPLDHPRPPVQSFRGGRQIFTLPTALSASLAALAQAEGVTLFMLLLAAWQTLLGRYSRQDDIVVGTPVAGRHRQEIEGLIGCFINTLVLRADLSGDPSFRELLQRVRQMCLQAYAHQDLPFEKLVEELHPARDLGRQPLFQAMFVFQDNPLEASEMRDLALQPLVIESGTAQFDLTLSLFDSADGLGGVLEYASDLFEAATIERMAGHLHTLLTSIVADPARRLSDLDLLTPAERRQLTAWNATDVAYAADGCLHTLIEQQAQRSAEAVAAVFDLPGSDGDAWLSYAELDRRANQLARYLRACVADGAAADELRVGICMERSLELIVGLLAIVKAGAAYVPLDPTYPPERLQFMLRDSAVPLLLVRQTHWQTQPALQALVATGDAPALIDLDADWSMIAQQPFTPPPVHVDPDQAAYLIYTSGSTGQPKGVITTHRAICNRLLWMQQTYGLTADDRVLHKTPFSFDVSVWELFWPLMTGAQLVIARPEGHRDPTYLTELIAARQITTLHFVPSMLRLLLEQPDLTMCSSLRRVFASGEALPVDVQERFFAQLPAALHNLYGPTEAAVDVTAWACQPDGALHTVPIGRPVANTQTYVLDPQLQPVPIGVAGELYLGGVQLARGYLKRPALTAEKFVPNPFSSQPGARLYATGDLARYRPDGAIEFLGRLDQQVKLRGFRIEPGEIESVLLTHPAICAAAVVLRGSDPQLVAYVVGAERVPSGQTENQAPASGTDSAQVLVLGSHELRDFLAQRLPDYLIPAAFVTLPALPLTPNGKLDLRALPAPDGLRQASATAFVAPQSDIEQQIAAVWRAALGLDTVGTHDNFFELGGHSLLLIQVHRQLRETLAPDLSVVELFQYPTISALVRHLASDQPAPPTSEHAETRATTRLDTMRQQRQFRQRSQANKKPPRS